MTTPKYSIDEVCDRGERIYEERIKALVEPQENGRFIVIDIESGDYEIAARGIDAAFRLRERRPDSVRFQAKIGYPAAFNLGWGGEPLEEPINGQR